MKEGGEKPCSCSCPAMDKRINLISKKLVHQPCTICGWMLSIMFFLTMILGPLNAGGMSEQSGYDWDISTKDAVIRADMIASGEADVDEIGTTNTTERTDASYYISINYNMKKCNNQNMFTPTTVQAMCEVDAIIFNHQNWKGSDTERGFCLLSNGACEQPVSPSNLFYGSNHNFTCELLSDSEVASASADLYAHLETTAGELAYGFFVDKHAPDDGQSCWTRSMFKVGTPISGYGSPSTVGDKQFYKIQDWMVEVQEDMQDFFGLADQQGAFAKAAGQSVNLGAEASHGGLDVTWFSIVMQNAEMMHTVSNDTSMAMFSMLFVWFWIVVHTGSCFIGSIGMLQIILSLPVSLFIYRVLFQIAYFETLQTLAIFVILGVGADDVFVMVDAWVQSRDEVPLGGAENDDNDGACCDWGTIPVCCGTCCPSACKERDAARADWYVRRMEYAYSRAMQAVFNTSWTTAMAFFATAVSPIMPISTFGIYAALCIIMNYLFVMTLTPATIIIQEYYIKGKLGGNLPTCCCSISLTGDFGPFSDTTTGWTPPPEQIGQPVATKEEEGEASASPKPPPLSTCCSPEGFINGYLNTMEQKTSSGTQWFAILTVVFLSAYGIFSCVAASQLTPPTEAEQWFPDDHIYSRALESMDKFLTGDDDSYALFKVVYGMKSLDRSDYNIYIPGENRGETKYDSNFDLQPAAAQDAFLDACDTIRNYPCKEKGCQFGLLIRPNTTTCFLEEYQSWHYSTYGQTTYDCTATEFYERLTTFRENTAPKRDPYGDWSTEIGMIDGELKFAAIDSRMTMKVLQSVTVKRPIMVIAEDLVSELTTTSTLSKPFQWTWDWVWYETEEGLILGLMLGMAIALPVALITLVFATGNVVIALYAIVSIGFVVASVLGACKAYLDWDLGIAESVAGVIVIGLAVDYTIHMGHMYDHAHHEIGAEDREARFRFAVEKMGTTVFAGAITTAGSGIFLYFTVLLFFGKMATLIVFTIFFSFVYSFGFFMAALLLAGPEGEFGRIKPYLIKLGIVKEPEVAVSQNPPSTELKTATPVTDVALVNLGSKEGSNL